MWPKVWLSSEQGMGGFLYSSFLFYSSISMRHVGLYWKMFFYRKTKHSSVSADNICGFTSCVGQATQFIWPNITNPDLLHNKYSIQHLLSLQVISLGFGLILYYPFIGHLCRILSRLLYQILIKGHKCVLWGHGKLWQLTSGQFTFTSTWLDQVWSN